MAIDPPSDVVLEVARAADPTRAAAAAQRLNALAASAGQTGAFAQTLAQTGTAGPAGAPVSGLANARSALLDANAATSAKAAKAQVDFEAMLLNGFVNEMMPKDAQSVFGGGMAGDMWKSMLADQISHQIAKSGELGIARRLFAARPLSAGDQLEHAARVSAEETHDAAQMSVNGLAQPSGVGFDNSAALFADRERS